MAVLRCCTWRPIGANVGGSCAPIGWLEHQQVGYGSLFGYFSNPAVQVSAHFWVGRTGVGEQYVDTARAAWHAKQLNGRYLGAEFEGMPDDALTPAQVAKGGEIAAELLRVHGIPLTLCNRDGDRGLGYHRMPGGVATVCPSDLRLSARPAILAAAGAPGAPSSPPAAGGPPAAVQPSAKGKSRMWTHAQGGYYTCDDAGGVFAFGGAPHFGALPGMAKPDAPIAGGTSTRDGRGYWLVSAAGSVYTFGAAHYYGPLGRYLTEWRIGTPANPVVGIAADDGDGYVLAVRSEGREGPDRYAIPSSGRYAA